MDDFSYSFENAWKTYLNDINTCYNLNYYLNNCAHTKTLQENIRDSESQGEDSAVQECSFWLGLISDATRREHDYSGYARQILAIKPDLVLGPDGKPYLRWNLANMGVMFPGPRPGDGLRWAIGYSLWSEREGGVCFGEQSISGTSLVNGEMHTAHAELYLPLPTKDVS